VRLRPWSEGSIPSSSTKVRQGGRCELVQLTTRRPEKPDKHVRLVPLAPTFQTRATDTIGLRAHVTVAEWLRRQIVDLSTRVQFPPVTPVVRASFNGENTSVLTKKCRFDSGRLFHTVDIRGLGKRINPLGTAPSSLGPRESRFESEVPDQISCGVAKW
jgi:hypothetical protein